MTCSFFLMIPATYVFLTLYSLINLNVINWGTREAVAKAIGKEEKKAVRRISIFINIKIPSYRMTKQSS